MEKLVLILFLSVNIVAFSQYDSLNKLEEIVLYGNFSPDLNTGYSVEIITDSIIKNEINSLGNFLQNHTNLYFKQNGNGMVSSISLRGTSASHTGIFWNGIAINSSLNGQTDFNTLPINSFEGIEIRKGGGSVLFGSGAIGGAVNMRDKVIFKPDKNVLIQLGGGSYNTFKSNVLGLISGNKYYAKVSFNTIFSDNDYQFPDNDLNNENGEFKNYGINSAFGWRFNDKNQIAIYTSYINNDRNTSRTLTATSNAKLKNKNGRFLLNWNNIGNQYASTLKLAYLNENYEYFFDKDLQNSSLNKSKSFITQYNFNYFLNNKISLNSGIDYTHSLGQGSNISNISQNDVEAFVLLHHKAFLNFVYNISVRKGFSSDYNIPFIYALDLSYRINNSFKIKANYSTNYRLPTFNDLYWEPGGNPNLKSEENKSAEFGIDYQKNKTKFELTSYWMKNKNLIQWIPISSDFWQPENIQKTSGYGLEFSIQHKRMIGDHKFQLQAQYAYSVSKDDLINKQLIYVPFHKANSNFNYNFKKLNLNYNLQFTGKVYTTTSNSQNLDNYWLSNIGISYKFLKNDLKIGLRLNNLLDKNYQSVAYRPMPGRNFEFNINYKID